jgi:hypothetical protein
MTVETKSSTTVVLVGPPAPELEAFPTDENVRKSHDEMDPKRATRVYVGLLSDFERIE